MRAWGTPCHKRTPVCVRPAGGRRRRDEHVGERGDDLWVELRGVGAEDPERCLDAHPRPVRARRGHRLEDVGDGEHAHRRREVLGAQPVRIAAAVEALVMRGGERREVREAGDALEDPRGDERVLADLRALRGGQPGGLVEDAVGDRQLADVVEHRRAPQVGDLGLVGAERGGDARGEHGDEVGVAVGPRRLHVDDARERGRDPVQVRVVGGQQPLVGLPGGDVRAAERRPEVRVVTACPQRRHEVGVEPLAAAARRDRARRVGAALAVEDLRRLREAHDARQQRDLLAAQPERLPVAVPVLVERPDRVGGLGLEPEQERDLGAAVAARQHQRARDLALVLDRLQPAGAGAQRPLRGDGPQRPHEGGDRARPVRALGRALGLVVVGVEQRGHLGRVRRAARVLHQQRVEQVRAGGRVEPELVGDPHADDARAHGVPGRLALGDVEGVREPADHARHADSSRDSCVPIGGVSLSVRPTRGARSQRRDRSWSAGASRSRRWIGAGGEAARPRRGRACVRRGLRSRRPSGSCDSAARRTKLPPASVRRDERDVAEHREERGRLRAEQLQRRLVDEVERVDPVRPQHAPDLAGELHRRQVPGDGAGAERVADERRRPRPVA